MEETKRPETGGEAFVRALEASGVDRIFINPGLDTTPVQGAIARLRAQGKPAPRLIFCPDEASAFTAAHGYAMVSGKPQVIMVFSDLGTLQIGGALTNASAARAPIVLCAGRTMNNKPNWRQEPFDQGAIVRNYVKWDHEVSPGEDVFHTLQQSLQLAADRPGGLVYLCTQRESLTGQNGEQRVSLPKDPNLASRSGPDAESLASAAQLLASAENVLILTAGEGRHPNAVPALVELAELLAARVITTEFRMSFPSDHALCAGVDSSAANCFDDYIREADVVLLVDYDPQGPRPRPAPRAETRIVNIDTDPAKKRQPLWGRPADVLLQADYGEVLPSLNELVRQQLAQQTETKIDSRARRHQRLVEEHRKHRDEWRTMAESAAEQIPISTEWLCYWLNQVIGERDIVVNMAIFGAASVARQIERTVPGTLFGCGGMSIGWPLAAAFGAKLAAPDRMVVSILGDGGFIYGRPTATLWSAAAHNAPFMTVILNNQGYNAIRSLMRAYGENCAVGEEAFELGTAIPRPPDYASIGRACGAYGVMVDDPAELPAVLQEAVAYVRGGISAVVDVRV